MILRIFLIFLFLVLCGFLLYFIFGIFIPAVKNQIIENQDPVFSNVELNYVGTIDESKVHVSENRAVIDYGNKADISNNRLNYNGIKNCALFNSIYDTATEYTNTCIGFGDCIKVCPQEAIRIENDIAVITRNCCGCGNCISVCPKDIIKLVPENEIKKSFSEHKYFKFWKSCYKIFHK